MVRHPILKEGCQPPNDREFFATETANAVLESGDDGLPAGYIRQFKQAAALNVAQDNRGSNPYGRRRL